MSIFDSITGMAEEKFGLSGGKAGGLVSSVLSMIISDGGLGGFLDRFRSAGLGDTVNSWITTGDNAPLSGEQLESALGEGNINDIAAKAGIERSTATSALSSMIPQVVDRLTPDGEVPESAGLLSTLGGYLGGFGGAAAGAVGAAGVMASNAFGSVGGAASDVADKGKDALRGGISSIGNAAGSVSKGVGGAINSTTDRFTGDDDSGGSSILKWLIPLLLLGLLLVLGYMFCGKSTPTVTTNSNNANGNANANKAVTGAKQVDSSVSIKAENGKYTVTGGVPDEATKKQIMDAMTAQYGAGNVNFDGLKVDANAKPFAAGWWDNFSKLLPNLKDWKTGVLAFAGGAITEATGLPAAALAQIKSLFSGWTMPLSIAGAEGATKQANEEALKELGSAGSIDEIIKALNVSIINFASGKSDIPADAKPILEKAADVMKKQPAGTTVEIGGYTDNKGNADGNKKLSQSRADSVKKALVGLGVTDAMLKSVGYGDANPVGDNNTDEGRFKNRRIEYKKSDGSAPTSTTTTTTTTGNANSGTMGNMANHAANGANHVANAVH